MDPILVVDPADIGAEVLISIEYEVDEANEEQFKTRMESVRRIRMRTVITGIAQGRGGSGALRRAFRGRLVDEYQRQCHDRLIASDRDFEQLATALSRIEPRTRLMFRID